MSRYGLNPWTIVLVHTKHFKEKTSFVE